jgi:hypothetical protein
MVDTYPKPKGVSDELWKGALRFYPDIVKQIYNIAIAPGFAYEGRTKYDAINEQIKTVVIFFQYREVLSIWRDQLLSTTQVDPTPELTPSIITRQIVVCRS